jgi:hypothetical protein
MSWSASKIFLSFIEDSFEDTASFNLDADALKAALFNDSITPSQTVTSANAAYGAGVWASGGITDTGASAPAGWPTVGRPLASVSSAFASNVYTFTAANTASANSTTTLAATYGTLCYNDTLAAPVADQAFCYNYFGGAQQVTNGSFTIVWDAVNGIFKITA